ncbi:Formiminotetrahydrofolate cyclodeaminase [Saccharopolyspora antimicrobica]|uniref:Formiminotetrahydrofolate cyclodeaminase n=1 Tax=Saccharopolyspora antimicrobica TaxID=455193 RepID=A0A1I5CE30_9PSEU|nr:cyclodeaminase/cyclohydrolase family protein [Saccharopolyspora antimicrobica]RKT88887.1 formiminotetrahydrofolate cyclodeaminase [Saccharopolyspora antimicrobica]SFN85183.1 Formiminotetrahydrofolate cyclodeaminase [Saccharopolyspora antimicrobica]
MRLETLETFLSSLAARVPAPGGGASAGVHAAQAAALIGMVARYSDGEKYAQHAATVNAVREASDELREHALTLAEEDASAFGAVGNAYGLPRSSDEEKAARSQAIAAALVEAGRVPAKVVAVAERVVGLAEQLLPIGNRNVISDVAAAADAARAAATTARVNVEVNLAGITGAADRSELTAAIAGVDDIAARADKITAAVREVIAR